MAADWRTVATAATHAKYTPLRIRLAPAGEAEADGAAAAAVPVMLEPSGERILVVVPQDFFPAAMLSAAAASDFVGSIGPYATYIWAPDGWAQWVVHTMFQVRALKSCATADSAANHGTWPS